jgi:hypothetical protein
MGRHVIGPHWSCRSVIGPIGFDPETEGQVFSLRYRHIYPELLFVTISQYLWIDPAGCREALHIITVALIVAFEFRKGNVMGFQREQPKTLPLLFKDWC